MIARWCGLAFLSFALCPQETAASPHPKRSHAHRRARPAQATFSATAVNDPATRPVVAAGSAGSGVLRAEILLSRAHFSCGEIDGHYGQNLHGAIRAFQEARGLPARGVMDDGSWAA